MAAPSNHNCLVIRFTALDDGTRVDLEHRGFERMGPGGATMRTMVDSPGGWGSLLQMFTARLADTHKTEGGTDRA